VKVVFSKAAVYVDTRILEYSGIDPTNPLDVVAGASGTAGTSDSGPATTTNANDLLVGANMTTWTTSAAGSGWTNRIITDPNTDIAEDRIVSTTGTYRATASVSSGSPWVMQMVAFRGAPTDVQPPGAPGALSATAATSARIDLSWGAAPDDIGVTGYLIERCTGGGCSTFTQIAAPAGTGLTYSDPGLTPSTSYSYRVRARDAAGNLGPYSNVSTATTLPDTTPPTAPASLTASAFSSTQTCWRVRRAPAETVNGHFGESSFPRRSSLVSICNPPTSSVSPVWMRMAPSSVRFMISGPRSFRSRR
jgi:hypothetical protein